MKKINDNLWMFGLFTSNSITNINGFIIKNIELSNNMFSYVNPPIFIRNDLISEFSLIDLMEIIVLFPLLRILVDLLVLCRCIVN